MSRIKVRPPSICELNERVFTADLQDRMFAIRNARDAWLRELVRSAFVTIAGVVSRTFRRRIQGFHFDRRKLAALTDRQLRDMGIDLALAGRTRSAEAKPNPSLEGLR